MGDHSTTSSDFHKILGVTKNASMRDIVKAYKKLVMRWHPDKNPSSKKKEAEAKIRSINQAYTALKEKKQEEKTMNGGCDSGDDDPTTPKSSYDYPRTNSQYSSMPSSLSKCASKRGSTPSTPPNNLPKSMSRRSTNPIMFSYSTVRRKPPPIEKKLECSLEELCNGCVKKIKITRDVVTQHGTIVQEEELLRIKIKPGWKKGTKITFEGIGDERPGHLPADITFLIDEKRHPLFKRDGDDLVLAVEIPLVKALTGCSLTIPLLGGEKMNLSLDDIVYPGYEKIVEDRGMPNPKQEGGRGNLRIKFRINFPTELSEEQRSDIYSLLQESC
ncbi:Dnaj protein-like protein [Thalictrum thalictroides]|uniref:Dnaj protein-like protein n=1 Tax=Thalictrum thalictroides TaxID=46969 RepID=A0A7J6VED9_THATH|nr:Dnaj protein-like protein [Thalictrum thalictroides]